MRNSIQLQVKLLRTQPMTPAATVVWKKIFLDSFRSARAPNTGPSRATMTVTMEMAIE